MKTRSTVFFSSSEFFCIYLAIFSFKSNFVSSTFFFFVSALKMIFVDNPKTKAALKDAVYVDAADTIDPENDGKTVIVTGNYENYEDDDYCEEVIAYKATGDGLGEGDSLTKEGSAVGFHDDIFYYYDDIDDDEGDLYSYQGGTSKLLAKNDSGSSVFIGDDGVVLGYTDWDYNDGSGDLSRYGKDGSKFR